MEDPVNEIPRVIHLLTQSTPSVQLHVINKYFTPDASFTHPFVRTGNWDFGSGWNSRWAVERIYRWYKIMSPRIDLHVDSVAYDEKNKVLYVSLWQNFRVWVIPGYSAKTDLVCRLRLEESGRSERGQKLLRIKSQEDCYQFQEWAKFGWLGLWRIVVLVQWIAMFGSIILAYIGFPVTYLEEQNEFAEIKPKEARDLKPRRSHASPIRSKEHNQAPPILRIVDVPDEHR